MSKLSPPQTVSLTAPRVLPPSLLCAQKRHSSSRSVPVPRISSDAPHAAVEWFPQQRSKLLYKPTPSAKKPAPAHTAFGLGTKGRSPAVRRPALFSWKALCCCLVWKHRCSLCSAFWCHQFRGMKSWPCACKWKISIRVSEAGRPSKFPL